MKIYLDLCCFNRPFDDQTKARIKLETEAKLVIQEKVRSGNLELVWSYILEFENINNPYEEKKIQIEGWKRYCTSDVTENTAIIELAKKISGYGLKKLDSLHIACAIESNCEYFISTDDKILARNPVIKEIEIIDPFGFIKEQLS
jgi:predicted nucleic acid-binding protein